MSKESKNSPKTQKLIRSFGRIKSRKISDHKEDLLQNLLPKYQIFPDFWQKNQNFAKKSFEIGFGFGDFLFHKAKNNPNQLFLGSEPHINGVAALLLKLNETPLQNLKISTEDARTLLESCPDQYFDEFYILFPDPWPKAKHFKRRLIDTDFLDNFLANKLKPGAKLVIATDHDSYKTWILAAILKSQKFHWPATQKSHWQQFPDDWITTKYQKKAQREGRTSIILNLCRKS